MAVFMKKIFPSLSFPAPRLKTEREDSVRERGGLGFLIPLTPGGVSNSILDFIFFNLVSSSPSGLENRAGSAPSHYNLANSSTPSTPSTLFLFLIPSENDVPTPRAPEQPQSSAAASPI